MPIVDASNQAIGNGKAASGAGLHSKFQTIPI